MTAYDALAVLKSGANDCALVCDEYGEVQGIVTLRDVLGGLVGMVNNPPDTPQIVRLENDADEYVVDARFNGTIFCRISTRMTCTSRLRILR